MKSQIDTSFGQFTTKGLLVRHQLGQPSVVVHIPSHLKPNEVAFGFNKRDVYVYDSETFAVKKFNFYFDRQGGVWRYDVTNNRSSTDFKTTVMNTVAGENHYQCVVKPALKKLFPRGKIVRLGRGPGLSTKDRGTVKKEIATHFDIYVRH
jgi:hypothetical protein